MKKVIIAILLLIAFGSIPLSAQFSVPIKWQSCKGDANYNNVTGNLYSSSNGKFVYSVWDSIHKLDEKTGVLIQNYNLQNFGRTIKSGVSVFFTGDDRWMIGSHYDTNGVFALRLDGTNQTKIYKIAKEILGIAVDSNNKRIFFSERTDDKYYGKIWVVNYETNQEPSVFLDSVYGGQLQYDHKRNYLIYQDVVREWKPYIGDMLIYDAINKTHVQQKRVLRDDDPNKIGFTIGAVSPEQDRIGITYKGYLIYNLNTNEFEKDSLESVYQKIGNHLISFVKNDNFLLIQKNISSDTSIYEIIHKYTKQVVFREALIKTDFAGISQKANSIRFVASLNNDLNCYYNLNLDNIFSGVGGDGILFETVYPNPVNNYLQITLVNAPTTAINATITDLTGNVISTFSNLTVNNNHIELDLTSLANGSYFLTLNSTNYQKSFKILKM